MRIDAPQRADAQALAELVQDGSRRHPLPIGQARKAPPGAVLVQQLDQQIEGTGWRQQHQQRQAKQLRRRPQGLTALAPMGRQQLVDEIVGQVIGQQVQQRAGPGGGQGSLHGPRDYRGATDRPVPMARSDFSRPIAHPSMPSG